MTRPVERDWNRILSAGVVAAWLVLMAAAGGAVAVLKAVLQTALPLACIWYPDALGHLTTMLPGPFGDRPMSRESPGCVLRAVAWLALLAVTFGRLAIVALFSP